MFGSSVTGGTGSGMSADPSGMPVLHDPGAVRPVTGSRSPLPPGK